MLLVAHIIIAITSILFATGLVIWPTRRRIAASNTLIGLTLFSGTMLIFQGADILNLCLSGLFYSVAAISLTLVARRRLQAAVIS